MILRFVFLICLLPLVTINGSFHKIVSYYETLHASHLDHKIVKRGLQESDHPFNKIKEISFTTLGRKFRLILSPKRGLLHSEFSASSVDENGKETPVAIDHESFYDGRVFGEMDSSANVHLDEGVLTASIRIGDETYHIEPSWRHLPGTDMETMVAYRASDVNLNADKNDTHQHCAYIKEGIEVEQEEEEDDFVVMEGREQWAEHKIVKRHSLEGYEFQYRPNKTRCPLLLVADHRFFQYMGGSDSKITINYLISLIDRVHKIFNETIWYDSKEKDGFNGMGFVIKKILVHSEPAKVRQNMFHYNMVKDKWDVRTLLEVFSRDNTHKDYCLAHLFTDLRFEGGILGLAYVGSSRRNSVGGICTPEYFKSGYTLFLNSGLSSSRNHYGQRVITREADLVTAHEFGHNWGSEHDPDVNECSPSSSQGGSYLMYTYSVSGYDINNKKFSPCSLRSIRKVLQTKSARCFSEAQESFCGNLRVEKMEECDAGLLGSEDNDPCCNKFCKLRKQQGVVCSDKNSPCCSNCQFMRRGVKCREGQSNTCEQDSYCTGYTADCPKSQPVPDGITCVERGQCQGGKCIPYCEVHGFQSCMCDNKIEDACKRCCRMSLNDTCTPINPVDLLHDGTPCVQGFCNAGVCEKTIQDVVERFWDIIEEININKLLLFLHDNMVGTVIVLTSIVWIPASLFISYVDKRRLKGEEKSMEWDNREDFTFYPTSSRNKYNPSSYPKKVIYTKVTRNYAAS